MSSPPGEKFCNFDSLLYPNIRYICLEDEVCCSTGCCPDIQHHYLHTWYFWIIIVVVIIIFYGLSEYCKRIEKMRMRRLRTAAVNARRPRRRRPEECNVDNLFERLIYSYSSNFNMRRSSDDRPPSEPPPKYSDAVLMPKPRKKDNQHVVQIHHCNVQQSSLRMDRADSEVNAPTYEEAMLQRNK